MLLILAVFLLVLILRLIFASLTMHVDIFSQGAWGEWIYINGPRGFYNIETWIYSWPNHPPLSSLLYGFDRWLYFQILEFFRWLTFFVVPHLAPGHMLWWFEFVKWFDIQKYEETALKTGYLMVIKLFPILADLGLAAIIYYLAKLNNLKKPVVWIVIYLFSPFSFYLSALWGQTDGVAFTLSLAAFLSLLNKKTFLSIIFFAISINLKPTILIFLPVFIYLLIRVKPAMKSVILGLVVSILMTFWAVAVLTDINIIQFTKAYLFPKIVHRAEFRVTTNSFNFWHILVGNQALGQDWTFLLIPAKIWGYAIFAFLNILAFRILSKITYENIFKALFLVGAGGWLFLTNMLERYFFAGVVSGLFLAIYYPQILKYWLALSLIFFINLYHGWWYPEFLEPLRLVLIWQDGLITRVLSLINVLIFLRIVWLTNKDNNLFISLIRIIRTQKESMFG